MTIFKKDIKLGVRYIVIMFLLYLIHMTLQATWLASIKDVDSTVMSVSIGGLYATVAIVFKAHFENKVANHDE